MHLRVLEKLQRETLNNNSNNNNAVANNKSNVKHGLPLIVCVYVCIKSANCFCRLLIHPSKSPSDMVHESWSTNKNIVHYTVCCMRSINLIGKSKWRRNKCSYMRAFMLKLRKLNEILWQKVLWNVEVQIWWSRMYINNNSMALCHRIDTIFPIIHFAWPRDLDW